METCLASQAEVAHAQFAQSAGTVRILGNVERGSPGNAPLTLTSLRARARSSRSGRPVSPEDQLDKGGSEKKSGGGLLPGSCARSGLAGLWVGSGSARRTSELGFTLADVLELRRGANAAGRSVQSFVLPMHTDQVRRYIG
ncbi:hypothetical protein AMELA_G00278350 [Ameiurus melas]|uniref:Uncharacterized protein n=1 Tax=Ameiurus melas TaxID=219545 RepID=A0A7J5ZJM5_AMEME|nr:hypothetical protein AMELA_G00278350 [Ameiurus melas]